MKSPEETPEAIAGERQKDGARLNLTMDLETQKKFPSATNLEFVHMPAAGSETNGDNHEKYGRTGKGSISMLGKGGDES